MKITLENIGKRFNREWIFRGITSHISEGKVCAIKGPNGSGKSTLLKLISQGELPSEGKITLYNSKGEKIEAEKAYQQLSYAAPYVDLPEQLTLKEFFNFHQKFIPLQKDISFEEFVQIVYLQSAINKQISNFSSGMKQRLKLGISILSNSKILILDEPTSNLDEEGIALYCNLLKSNTSNRITFIGTNEEARDLVVETENIVLTDYKKKN